MKEQNQTYCLKTRVEPFCSYKESGKENSRKTKKNLMIVKGTKPSSSSVIAYSISFQVEYYFGINFAV
jgi:hypothetical protein